jgi:hypothetical protein
VTDLIANATTDYRLQEELKKSAQLSEELAFTQVQLKDKTVLSDELQRSLSLLKEELATTLQRFEQTKRHLEDQLIEEERAREELQEQNLEFRKTNKKLAKDLEKTQPGGSGGSDQRLSSPDKGSGRVKSTGDARQGDGDGSGQAHGQPTRGAGRNRVEQLLLQLERSQMRENDLVGALARVATAAAARSPPMRRQLSRMPSTTVITRFVPADNSEKPGTHSMVDSKGSLSGSHGHSGGKIGGVNIGSSLLSVEAGMEEEDSTSALEINEQNFEAYHQEVHRMLTEIEDGKDKITKQQKVITVGVPC